MAVSCLCRLKLRLFLACCLKIIILFVASVEIIVSVCCLKIIVLFAVEIISSCLFAGKLFALFCCLKLAVLLCRLKLAVPACCPENQLSCCFEY
jgi:hypothetical protein